VFASRLHLPISLLTLYSEVHRARSKKTGALVALKKIIMHNEKDGVCVPPSAFSVLSLF
jgi:hypothetical protein